MRVLITGHTGFKGSWLALALLNRGHQVSGIALDPLDGGLFDVANVSRDLEHDVRCDIRDAGALAEAVRSIGADVVFHLAAQPLVRESYLDPRTTFETNAMGTLNVLEALAGAPKTKAAVIITTDKVYRNVGQAAGYVEADPLGGRDPYSASKAMADILTQSWVASFPGVPTAIARAGNVIGGGDVSTDRLLVDLVAGFEGDHPVGIRNPDAVRPWQHVLDCIGGYLALASSLLEGEGKGEWNFGPDPESFQTVRQLADSASAYWGGGARWEDQSGDHPHEALLLTLDSSKAQNELGWRNILDFDTSLAWTLDWYRSVYNGDDARELTSEQIRRFSDAGGDLPWAKHF